MSRTKLIILKVITHVNNILGLLKIYTMVNYLAFIYTFCREVLSIVVDAS